MIPWLPAFAAVGSAIAQTLLRDKLPDVVTFPQLLREHGWYTASYGKIFHEGGGRDPAAQAKWADLGKSWDEARSFETTPAALAASRSL